MLKRLVRRFGGDRRGGVMLEAAVIMPLIGFVILAGMEVGRFTLLQQKLNRTAVSMADLVSQAEELSESELDKIFEAVQYVARPFALGSQGLVIVSAVSATEDDPPRIDWQRTGGGTFSATSLIGAEGDNATLPEDFIVRPGETVIVAEVVYDYEPVLFSDLLGAQQLRHRAMFRPRFGALSELQEE